MMKIVSKLFALVALLISPVALFGQTNDLNAPLPTLDSLVARVIEQSKKEGEMDRTFKQHYSYKRSRITENHTEEGVLTSHEEKTGDKHPHGPAPTNRVASVSGTNSTSADPKFGKSDMALLNTNLLNRFELTLVGRRIVDGRPALLVDFKPKSKTLPESGIKDRFINHAAGRLWIDEADATVTEANVRLTEQVNVFGGLVGAIWKFNGNLRRSRTDDGLWYLTDFVWHLEGREVLATKIIDFHERWTNVTKTQ